MRLSIPELKQKQGDYLTYEFQTTFSNLDIQETQISGDTVVNFVLQAAFINNSLYLKGNLLSRPILECARCLEQFEGQIETNFLEILSLVHHGETDSEVLVVNNNTVD